MEKTKKLFAILLAVSMLSAVVAGCASKPSSQTSQPSNAPIETVTPSEADSYPSSPIRAIVPFAAGGGGDTMTRTVEPFWAEQLHGNFVVENMGGAGTQIGMTEIYNSVDDPYCIGVISQPHTSLTIDVQGAPYKLEDFYCLNLHNFDPQSVFAVSDAPWNDCVELFKYIEENPGKVTFGVSQMTGGHLFAAYLQNEMGLDFTIVPYDGGSTCRTALLGGLIDIMIMNETTSLGVENMKCLGVNWTESVMWDGVKTISEQFPDNPQLGEVGIACANFKFIGTTAKMKEAHPDIFNKLAETYEAAYTNEEHLKICEGQGLRNYMKWYGPEESQKLWLSAQAVSEKYAYLFK